MARFCPLFSGSGGNSYYLGSRSAGLLIDAGRSARQVEGMLKLCGVDPLAIQGILVTHEHMDHVSGLRVFARRYGLPVFASEGTLAALGNSLDGVETYAVEDGLQLAGMEIHPFPTSHDCAEPLGFRVRTEDGRNFALSTDLGYLSDAVKESLLGADFVVIESNHDREMLRTGRYPYVLKQRILSDRGHLSNDACAGFLPELAGNGTKRFLLAHLSRENNSPALALDTSLSALVRAGLVRNVDFLLETAEPENAARRVYIF